MERRDDDNTLFLAMALFALSSGADPAFLDIFYRRIRDWLRRTEHWEPELDMIFQELIHAPRRGFRERSEESREIATSVLEGFRRSFEPPLREAVVGLEGAVSEVRAECARLGSRLDAESLRTTHTASDLHTYVWLMSTGANIAEARIVRYVPVRVYVGDPVPGSERLENVVQAFHALGEALELAPADELPEELGSWYKRLFLKTRRAASHKEVQDSLAKAKAAVETTYLDKPQAEVTGLLADAAAKVITALSAVPGPCCGQAGSLLVVKVPGPGREMSMMFKTLTPMELRRLEENAAMLQRPNEILGWLGSLSSTHLPPHKGIGERKAHPLGTPSPSLPGERGEEGAE